MVSCRRFVHGQSGKAVSKPAWYRAEDVVRRTGAVSWGDHRYDNEPANDASDDGKLCKWKHSRGFDKFNTLTR